MHVRQAPVPLQPLSYTPWHAEPRLRHAALASSNVPCAVWKLCMQCFLMCVFVHVVLGAMVVCASWYVLAGHAEHVRTAVLSTAVMRSPAPHWVCAAHEVSRWLVLLWYVLAGHAEHVRRAVLLSAEMRSPAPHSCCAEHKASRWLVLLWNVLAGHAEHVRRDVLLSAEMRSPAPH